MKSHKRRNRNSHSAFAPILFAAVIVCAQACGHGSGAVSVSEPGVTLPLAANAGTKKNVKTCPRVEVRSVDVRTEFYREGLSFDDPPSVSTAPRAEDGTLTVSEVGPVLGSMVSHDVKTNVECTPKGFALTATLRRWDDNQGAAAKNVLWRPRVAIVVVLREPEASFEGIWKTRPTDGEEFGDAETPPFHDIKYPLTLTKILKREEPR